MEVAGLNITRTKNKLLDSLTDSEKVDLDNDAFFDDEFFSHINVSNKDAQKLGDLIGKLRSDENNRKKRFADYKRIAKDPIIGQAIEMMADDATQFDVEREKTVWIESKDKKYEKAINGIIEEYIEPFIDNIASCILSKGEWAFKVMDGKVDEDRDGFIDVVLLPYKNIEKLHHLILEDQTHYFWEIDDISTVKSSQDYSKTFKEFDKFIHFINYSIDNSDEVDIKVEKKTENKNTGTKSTEKKVQKVFILQGESVLTDKVIETYRILQAIENAIIRTRMAKSKMIRFINVDVSRLSDNKKAQNIINYIESALAVNEAQGQNVYESSALQAEPITVTVPVRNGVGAIHVEEFNTSADIKEIADLNYFLGKLFTGLRTPRSYFNFDENMPGIGVSGASLMRIDIRYARAVKKVQRIIVNGIKSLIDVFNEKNKEKLGDNPPDFKVKIVKVASAEDSERYTEFEQRLTTAIQMIQGIVSQEGGYNMEAIKAYKTYFTDVVPMKEIVAFLEHLISGKGAIKAMPPGMQLKSQPPTKQEEPPKEEKQ